jgi:hypothetical protein
MSIRSYQPVTRKTWLRSTVGATSLLLACVSGPAPSVAADAVYVRDHRAAKVFVVPLGRFRDTIVIREIYQNSGKAWTNSLYELDCRSRILRSIGGFAPEGPTTFKDSEFYAGAYVKAHDAFCSQYKDPAEWED